MIGWIIDGLLRVGKWTIYQKFKVDFIYLFYKYIWDRIKM